MNKNSDYYNSLLKETAEAVNLAEGAEGVRIFLTTVEKHPGISLKKLASEIELPLPVTAAIRRELEKRDVLIRRQGIRFSDAFSRKLSRKTIDAKPDPLPQENFLPENILEDISEELRDILDSRPSADPKLDQSKAVFDTIIRRISFMIDNDLISGRIIVFLGDDDLMSIAAGLAGAALNKPANRLISIDVDDRFLSAIKKRSFHCKPPVETILHDLRSPLTPDLRDMADVIVTDPPYTRDGISLFLSRAAEALKNEPAKKVMLFANPGMPQKERQVQSDIIEAGFLIKEIHRRFSRYEGASVIGSQSHFYYLESVGEEFSVTGKRKWEKIYTYDVNPTVKIYRCQSCRTKFRVGQKQKYEVIGELKESGCPNCGARKFQRVAKLKL